MPWILPSKSMSILWHIVLRVGRPSHLTLPFFFSGCFGIPWNPSFLLVFTCVTCIHFISGREYPPSYAGPKTTCPPANLEYGWQEHSCRNVVHPFSRAHPMQNCGLQQSIHAKIMFYMAWDVFFSRDKCAFPSQSKRHMHKTLTCP